MSNVMTYPNELYHYGVKGMKWGVRNDKPTTGRRRSPRDKKNLGRSAVRRLYNIQNRNSGVSDFAYEHPEVTAIAAEYAVVAVAVLAMCGAKKIGNLAKQGYFSKQYKASDIKRSSTSKNQDLKVINQVPGVSDSTLEKLAANPDISKLSDKEQKAVMKALKDGYFTNCVFCTTSAALRRKGYDVQANVSPGRGRRVSEMIMWWKGAKIENFRGESESNPKKVDAFHRDTINKELDIFNKNKTESESVKKSKSIKHMDDTLSKQGDGSYGDFLVRSAYSGHSVEYSVEKGKVQIYDNQFKVRYDSLDEFFSVNKDFYPEASTYIRLDNCEPDIDRMLKKRVIKPRGN